MGAQQCKIKPSAISASCNDKNELLFKAIRGASRTRNRKEETRGFLIEIEYLLESGADPEAQDSMGRTILHYVAKHWRKDFDDIMNASTEATKVDVNGNSRKRRRLPADDFRDRVRNFVAESIISQSDVNHCEKGGKTSLHFAALKGNAEVVRMLLSAGAEPDIVDKKNNTPLLLATEVLCDPNFFETTRQLVEAGANVDLAKNGVTVLHRACQGGDEKLVDLLLLHGASLTPVDRNGLNPLLHAVKSNSMKIVKQLIGAGADVNFVNVKGVKKDPSTPMTALHFAIMNDDLDMLECLLKHGADPNRTNKLGRSILSYASEIKPSKNMLPRIEMLLWHGADLHDPGWGHSKSPFELLVLKGKVAEVRLLLKRGLDLGRYSPQTPEDFSPLHSAISKDCAMLSLLLKFDTKISLDLEFIDGSGRSPLYTALGRNCLCCLELLLESGAKVDYIDAESRSPLEFAVSWWSLYGWDSRAEKEMELLVRAGAKIRNVLYKLIEDALTYFRWTAEYNLMYAYARGILKYRVLYESHQKIVAEPVGTNLPVELQPYYEHYTNEIDLLKNSPLYNSITYFDVLVDGKIYERVRDDRMYAEFDEEDLENRFPLYGQNLSESFARIRRMHKVWEQAVEKLSKHFGFGHDNYYFVVRSILKRLREDDLRSVADS
ncbi:hypothetical protein QAD02_024302 [Eretmocerus hayati]|uniref:Uncharacterized protein n=1 Tax=Eretmocerus hayati TaxID=131215 RepID=A0ACC2PYG8_9HYME|nr:hypothetical protein QAD02_024302 [Eretmocerus hayati]